MAYISQQDIRDKKVKQTIVEVRQQTVRQYDSLFLGMGDNGKDIHSVLSHQQYIKLADDQLYKIKRIGF